MMEKLSFLIENIFNVMRLFFATKFKAKCTVGGVFKVNIYRVIMNEATHKNNWKSFPQRFLFEHMRFSCMYSYE